MTPRNDDLSLKLFKASQTGFLPDISDSEVDSLDRRATAAYDGDVRPQANTLTLGESTMARREVSSNAVTFSSGALRLTHFTATKSETVTQICVPSGGTAAGATPTLVRMGLYRVENNGDITLLASTANDTTLFAATATRYTKTLDTPVQKIRGQRYAIGVLVVTAAAAPAFYGSAIVPGILSSQEPKLCTTVAGQTDLPASVASASLVATFSFYAEILP